MVATLKQTDSSDWTSESLRPLSWDTQTHERTHIFLHIASSGCYDWTKKLAPITHEQSPRVSAQLIHVLAVRMDTGQPGHLAEARSCSPAPIQPRLGIPNLES